MKRPVFRFAPSPNGMLHLGHAYSVLLNDRLAREAGGRLLLRIEDIDRERCRPEYEAAMLEDLAWLGVGFETPVRRQSEHMAEYAAALAKLDAMGVTYPAFLSRAEIAATVAASEARGKRWPRDPDGAALYPGSDRELGASEAGARIAGGALYATRLRMERAVEMVGPLTWDEGGTEVDADPAAWGDVILARRETPTSYHLSVVVDDALQGVTDVVRGADLRAATSVHRLLQALLDLPVPRYRHHRLITDATGRKLAKSDGDTGLAELRAAGVTAEEVGRTVGID